MKAFVVAEHTMINDKYNRVNMVIPRRDGKLFMTSGNGIYYPALEHDFKPTLLILYPDLDNPLSKKETDL